MADRGLMLDVDGVLVHPVSGGTWAARIAEDLGISPDALQRVFFRPHWQAIVTGQAPLDAVLARCLPALHPDLTVAQVLDYWFTRDARIDTAVLAQCDRLRARGWPIWLATNQEPLRARYLMEDLGLADHVDGILCSARIGAAKPDAAFFAAAARQAAGAAGLTPDRLVLVDDTPANVAAARRAGWQAHLWTGAESLADLLDG